MAETWSSSRQVIVVTADSYNYKSDLPASYQSAKRTYTETLGVTYCYQPTSMTRDCVCYGYVPYLTQRDIIYTAYFKGTFDLKCTVPSNEGSIQCVTSSVDDNGPKIMQFPKYFNSPTLPPNFDVSFRVWASYPLDFSSLIVFIQVGKISKMFDKDSSVITKITENIYDFSVKPNGILPTVGENVSVKVSLKDMIGREISVGW